MLVCVYSNWMKNFGTGIKNLYNFFVHKLPALGISITSLGINGGDFRYFMLDSSPCYSTEYVKTGQHRI